MDVGVIGIDNDPLNPLRRSLTQLFTTGKPFIRLFLCFIKAEHDQLRWLGVFVQSSAGRVIFFPSFVDTTTNIEAYRNESLHWQEPFNLDHISLEADLEKWHLTSNSSASHKGDVKTLQLGEGRVLWFGLSLASLSVLGVANCETIVEFTSPSKDIDRRLNVFRESRKNAQFKTITFNNEISPLQINPHFMHIAIIVGPKGFKSYTETNLGFPFGSPYLNSHLQLNECDTPCRSHRIHLSNSIDIEIISCKMPGTLNVPISITSPS